MAKLEEILLVYHKKKIDSVAKQICETTEYSALKEDFHHIFKELIDCLPDEKRPYFYELESIKNEMISICMEQSYQAGTREGLHTGKEIFKYMLK